MTSRQPGGWPGRFRRSFRQSPLRSEARLLEARAASLSRSTQGRRRDSRAAGRAEAGPKVTRSCTTVRRAKARQAQAASRAPRRSPPLRLKQPEYDLALAYRALGRSAEADAILASSRKSRPGRSRRTPSSWLASRTWTRDGMRKPIAPLGGYLAANPRGDVAEFAMAHLVMARLGLGQSMLPGRCWPVWRRSSPTSKSLPPARLRVAEAALEAHEAERAAEQFKLVAGRPEARARPGLRRSGAKHVDASTPALQVRAYRGLGKALAELGKTGRSRVGVPTGTGAGA